MDKPSARYWLAVLVSYLKLALVIVVDAAERLYERLRLPREAKPVTPRRLYWRGVLYGYGCGVVTALFLVALI
jgi:hypothetical protein